MYTQYENMVMRHERRNHFRAMCTSRQKQAINEVDNETDEILPMNARNDKSVFANLNVSANTVKFLLDFMSATVNMLPVGLVTKFGFKNNLKPAKEQLRMYDDTKLFAVGMIKLPVYHPRTNHRVRWLHRPVALHNGV